jgi:hypothetical protein
MGSRSSFSVCPLSCIDASAETIIAESGYDDPMLVVCCQSYALAIRDIDPRLRFCNPLVRILPVFRDFEEREDTAQWMPSR